MDSPPSGCTIMTTMPASLRHVLERQPGIRQALVFGSVAAGTARADSDLDVALEAEHPLSAVEKAQLMAELAAATGRPIDLVDLKTVGEPLLGQILRFGQRVLGSPADHAALMRRHLFDNSDFQPYVSRMLGERRRAWKG
jgi:predicted nucleotidyltransferase